MMIMLMIMIIMVIIIINDSIINEVMNSNNK